MSDDTDVREIAMSLSGVVEAESEGFDFKVGGRLLVVAPLLLVEGRQGNEDVPANRRDVLVF